MDEVNWNDIINSAMQNVSDANDSMGQAGSLEGTAIENWLMPGRVQQREFGQQVALQKMQNEWNSEGERMKRMKDAGINPNVAAGGIAGAGASPSTGSPNSAIGAGAQSVGAAAQGASAVGDLLNAGVNAYEKQSLTPVEVDKRKAEIRDLLSSALHNDWLSYSISEMLPLQKANERADTYLKLANFAKAKQERLLIKKQVSEAEAHISELNAQASLFRKQGNLADALKLEAQARADGLQLDNDKKQWEKDWREKYKYDPSAPVDVALEQAMVNDASEDVVTTIGESVKRISYNERSGFNEAEIDDNFNKAFNEFLGQNAANAEYAHMGFYMDIAKLGIKYYLEALSAGAKDPATFVIQKLMVPSLRDQADEYEKRIRKPKPEPKSKN